MGSLSVALKIHLGVYSDMCYKIPSYSPHSLIDDIYGLFIGVVLASAGISILGKSGLITGGIAGVALLASFVTRYSSSMLVPLINIPFLIFALFTMGRPFTVKSVIVSFSLGLGVYLIGPILSESGVDPEIGCILGGTFLGMGILCLARHNASMGGTGSLVLWVQRRFSVNAGISQLVLDAALFMVASCYLPLKQLIWSLIGTIAMNAVLISWHKPGRYRG